MLTLVSNDNRNIIQIEKLVKENAFMRRAVMEVDDYDGTLVAFTGHVEPKNQVRRILESAWNGPVEVYCASEHLVGGFSA